MQIGNPELDRVYEEAVVPAVKAAGLDPRRIDLDNEGGLLKSEIVSFLERSEIIIGDLTNERPNCYLEVGYAMGLGRFRHLILTVREDHYPGSPGYTADGPKVHFDLTGYDLLFWTPDRVDHFRRELEERIRRRLAITGDTGAGPSGSAPISPGWFEEARESALPDLLRHAGRGFMEIRFFLDPPKPAATQSDLLEAARHSTIDTFGWPIGLVLDRDEYRPRPTGEGIRAVVQADRWNEEEKSYDYWELRTDGDFYQLSSLFEDQRGSPDRLFFNTRIVRVTEAVLYCARLYERLGVESTATVRMRVAHGGLEERVLTSATRDRHLSQQYRSGADEAAADVSFALGSVAEDLVSIVQALVSPLFVVFDFFELGDEVFDQIVNRFVAGQVS